MSITPERRMKLMAFADGELEGNEREEVLGWLSADLDAVRFVNEVAALGEGIKLGHEHSTDAKAVASFDIADAIMGKLDGEDGKNDAERSPVVVPFDATRARRQDSAQTHANANAYAYAKKKRNAKIGAAAVAALALAASVLLLARSKDEKPMAAIAPSSVEPVLANGSGPGVDVDLVESPGQTVSVFYLPSEISLTTSVVVWVDETGEK